MERYLAAAEAANSDGGGGAAPNGDAVPDDGEVPMTVPARVGGSSSAPLEPASAASGAPTKGAWPPAPKRASKKLGAEFEEVD